MDKTLDKLRLNDEDQITAPWFCITEEQELNSSSLLTKRFRLRLAPLAIPVILPMPRQ